MTIKDLIKYKVDINPNWNLMKVRERSMPFTKYSFYIIDITESVYFIDKMITGDYECYPYHKNK